MSLQGLTVAITGSRRALELAHVITSFGGRPYIAPTIGIEPRQDLSNEIERFINLIIQRDIDYVIFMTGPGVYSLMSAARTLGLEQDLIHSLEKVIVVARSMKPNNALSKHGVKTDIMPDENTAEGIAKLLRDHNLTGKKIGVLWHGSYSTYLIEHLEKAGAQVFGSSTYTYSPHLKESGEKILKAMGFNYISPDEAKVIKLVEDINNGLIDAITFTSPPSARDLFNVAKSRNLREPLISSLNSHVIVAAVGPSTKKTLEENYVHVDVMPAVYKMGAMVKSLSDYLSQSQAASKKRQK